MNNEVRNDLKERTFEFAVRIVKLCRVLDKKAGVPRTLANQLLRSGTSIGANVEEGQASQSTADFVSKYSSTKGPQALGTKEHQERIAGLTLDFGHETQDLSFYHGAHGETRGGEKFEE